jgi:hypothetical protein
LFQQSLGDKNVKSLNSADLTVTTEQKFPTGSQLKWLITALLIYFGLRLIFFATNISPYVPPDEVTHFGVSKVFSKVFLLPLNSPESYQFGMVTNIPWFYYWTMGKLLHLNFFGISDLLYLRLLNIPLAFGTIYFTWRILRLLTDDRLTQILLLVAITNTLMFSFLSASVSPDNLTNLLAMMAIYCLFAFFKEKSGQMLIASILCQMAGSLTKITFLPLILILNIILIINEFKNSPMILPSLKAYFKTLNNVGLSLVLGVFFCLLLNIQLYGGNYFKFGSLFPRMIDIMPIENAMQYRLAARNYIFEQFRQGHISIEKAREMASHITHEGDRKDTINLVQHYADMESNGIQLMSPLGYTAFWGVQMLATSYGIKAHIGMPNQRLSFISLSLLLLLTAVAIFARWRPRDNFWMPTYMAVISLFYAFILIYRINYPNYIDSKDIELTVAGRYIFPVIGPIYVTSSYYLMQLFRSRYARLACAICAAVIFVMSDFPFFMSHVTPEWFDGH